MRNSIKEKISDLLEDFKQYPDKYLTESDVRCALVSKLSEIPDLNELQDTKDGSKSIPIHTEVRWYGQSGTLKWRSDIVIIDVSTLEVKNKPFKLPSKGYGFNIPKVIIEIKFRRINGDSNSVFIKKINKDIEKLNKIKEEITGDYFCCLVILDKKDDINKDIPNGDGNLFINYKYACQDRPEKK